MYAQLAAAVFQSLVLAAVAADVVYVPSFTKYPGYVGNLAIAGQMSIVVTDGSNTTAKQSLTWSLLGLDSACTAGAADNVTNGCGIHIHTGTSCASAAAVGGHHFSEAVGADPWLPIVYMASSDGTSIEHAGVEVITGLSTADIIGRVVVVHELDSGKRVACGVIGTETGEGGHFVSFAAYPGYSGSLQVAGGLTVVSSSGTSTTAKQTLYWSLTGLDEDCAANAADNITNGCGIHIHTGTSCESADGVGGHYFSSALTSEDPWRSIVYVATNGSSREDGGVQVVTGLSAGDITGRVVVVHALAGGKRIACGVLSSRPERGTGAVAHVPSFTAYPGYSGDLKVAGSITLEGIGGNRATAGQLVRWDLTGLDAACTAGAADGVKNGCGIHVHTGTSCATASGVGGHYHSSSLTVDPWLPIIYVAASDGSSKEITGVHVVMGLSQGDLMGHVVVVHQLADGARIACGVIQEPSGDEDEDDLTSLAAQQLRLSLPFLLIVMKAVAYWA